LLRLAQLRRAIQRGRQYWPEFRTRRPAAAAPPSSPVSTDLLLWLKADGVNDVWQNDPPTVLADTDGERVARWEDSNGSANYGKYLAAATRPTWKENILNGKPSLLWSGADEMVFDTPFGPTVLDEFTLTFVISGITIGTAFALAGANNAAGHIQIGIDATGRPYLHEVGVSTLITATNPISTGGEIVTFRFSDSGNSAAIFDNGIPNGSVTGLGNSFNAPAELSRLGRSNGINNFAGHMHEVTLHSSALSDANVELNAAYLAAKYAV
jgi:hypothetical protein